MESYPKRAKMTETGGGGERLSLRARLQRVGTFIGAQSAGWGTWLLSLVLAIVVPCLPIGMEMLRLGHVSESTVYVTAAVLCAAYGFSAENNFYRAFYA